MLASLSRSSYPRLLLLLRTQPAFLLGAHVSSAPTVTQHVLEFSSSPLAPVNTPPASAPPAAAPSKPTVTPRPSRRVRVAALTLTDSAVNRIKTLLLRRPDAVGIKLGVRSRGCNGLSYTLDFLTSSDVIRPADEVVNDARGVKVVIDSKALMHLVGTTMDYRDTPLASEFVFENPNSKGSCGCGESFNV